MIRQRNDLLRKHAAITLLAFVSCGCYRGIVAGENDIPSLPELIRAAKTREAIFARYEAFVDAEIVSAKRGPKPWDFNSGHFIKDGSKRFINNVHKVQYTPDGPQTSSTWILGFDGDVGLSLIPEMLNGKIYRDIDEDLERTRLWGPETLAIIVPDTRGMTLSQFLEEDAPVVPSGLKLLKRVSVKGAEELDGRRVVVVEVVISAQGKADVRRFYLARDFEWALCRLEISNGTTDDQKLGTRLDCSDFKRWDGRVWYPEKATINVFQGQKDSLQYTTYKIKELKWPERIDPNIYAVRFPAGTHVYDLIKGVDYSASGSLDLPKNSDQGLQKPALPTPSEEPLPASSDSSHLFTWLVLPIGIFALALIIWLRLKPKSSGK